MIRYTRGPVRLAYTVHGTVEPTLVVVPGWVSHLTLDRETPEIRAFQDGLNPAGRTLFLDKRGGGHSDRPTGPENYTLDARVDDLRQVLDSAGIRRASFWCASEGGPIGLAFAARFPERVDRLVLYGTFARLTAVPDYPLGVAEANFRALVTLAGASWGLGARLLTDVMIPETDPARHAWFTTYQRAVYSPQAAVESFEALADLDVRDELARVRAPALVIHRRKDCMVPQRLGRDLAGRLAGARFVSLEGDHHFPYFGDVGAIIAETRRFLEAGVAPAPAPVAPLSPRERDVLGMLAEGRTNREIADALVVSLATVERHLSHLYAKIGARRRADAAAYAVRSALGAPAASPERG